jgi:FkbM family methyltransferase
MMKTLADLRTFKGLKEGYALFGRWWNLRRAKRRVFIDCGANTCRGLRDFIGKHPDFEFFAFEPQPDLQHEIAEVVCEYPEVKVTFYGKAVWVADEVLNFFLATNWGPNHRGGSTLLKGHIHNEARVDYDHPLSVDAIDFSRWLSTNFSERDYIVIKMDIEGAEYEVLEKMIRDGTLQMVNELYVEFHQHMNDNISSERHQHLTRVVRQTTHLLPWE